MARILWNDESHPPFLLLKSILPGILLPQQKGDCGGKSQAGEDFTEYEGIPNSFCAYSDNRCIELHGQPGTEGQFLCRAAADR